MGCISSNTSSNTSQPSNPHFGSLYTSTSLTLNTTASNWKFSEKHKLALTDFCQKPSNNIPKEIVNTIQSYLPLENLVILSRGDATAYYKSYNSVHHGSYPSYKLCLLGNTGVGKSSFVIRVVANEFIEEYDPTIVDSYRITVPQNGNKNHKVSLDILDTVPEEDVFTLLTDVWIRESDGFIVAYDLTDIKPIPCILIGCKGDLILNGNDKRCIDVDTVIEYCKDRNIPYVECSAKDNINIDYLIQQMIFVEMTYEHKVS